jgi:hypothetical protein
MNEFLNKFEVLRTDPVIRLALSSFMIGLTLTCAGAVLAFGEKTDFPWTFATLMLAFGVYFLGDAVGNAKKIKTLCR